MGRFGLRVLDGTKTGWISLRTSWEGLGSCGLSLGASWDGHRASREGVRQLDPVGRASEKAG